MIRDARIEKPSTNDMGLSDPVVVFTDNGIVMVAYWDSKDKYWHDTDGQTFANVVRWSEIQFPGGWKCDWSLYGGE